MLSHKKQLVEKFFEPIVKQLSEVNPNVLTLLGSIPSLLFFVAVFFHMYLWALIAFLGNLFDLIDGMVARKYDKTTKFGGFLDSTIDRVSDFLTITAFSFGGLVRWEITAPLLLFSFLTSYIRAQGGIRDAGNPNFAIGTGIIERPERLGLIFVSLVSYMLFPNLIIKGFNAAELVFGVLTLLSLYSVIQRIVYASKKL
jgi:archaetidylinositol phosphate synthase